MCLKRAEELLMWACLRRKDRERARGGGEELRLVLWGILGVGKRGERTFKKDFISS